jgi:hypothetical protein
MPFNSLHIVDDETGESLAISGEEWSALENLAKAAAAGDPDDVLASLPNSGDVDLQKFFAGLLSQLTDAISADLRTQGRAHVAEAEKKVYSPRSELAQAMQDALAQLSTLTPAQLKKAKALGPLFVSQATEDRVEKAQLREDNTGQPSEAECADLMATIEANARKTFRKNSVILR